jgi:hypothetical protein
MPIRLMPRMLLASGMEAFDSYRFLSRETKATETLSWHPSILPSDEPSMEPSSSPSFESLEPTTQKLP